MSMEADNIPEVVYISRCYQYTHSILPTFVTGTSFSKDKLVASYSPSTLKSPNLISISRCNMLKSMENDVIRKSGIHGNLRLLSSLKQENVFFSSYSRDTATTKIGNNFQISLLYSDLLYVFTYNSDQYDPERETTLNMKHLQIYISEIGNVFLNEIK